MKRSGKLTVTDHAKERFCQRFGWEIDKYNINVNKEDELNYHIKRLIELGKDIKDDLCTEYRQKIASDNRLSHLDFQIIRQGHGIYIVHEAYNSSGKVQRLVVTCYKVHDDNLKQYLNRYSKADISYEQWKKAGEEYGYFSNVT